jgi:hypothetical protein
VDDRWSGHFQFLRDLAANNHQQWFREHQEEYEDFILQPFRDLVTDLTPFMRKLNRTFVANESPDEHLSHIEIASAPEEGPHFKTSLYCFWWNSELNRLSDANLHIGLGAEAVTLGFSIYDWTFESARMDEVFKPRLRSDLSVLDEYIKSSYLRRGFDFRRFVRGAGRLGLREAEPFPDRGSEWSSTLGWVVSRQIKPGSSRLTPGSFLTECEGTFTRLYPLYVFASETRNDWKRVLKAKAAAG